MLGISDNNIEDIEDDKIEYENKIKSNDITKIYGMHFAEMAPEICLGYSRIRRFGNNQKLKINDYNTTIRTKYNFRQQCLFERKMEMGKRRSKSIP